MVNPLCEAAPLVPATPALVVNEQVVDANLQKMQAYVQQHGLRLRPHTKTHKSLHVARRQLRAGAAGLTVAKAGEAEVMAAAGEDLLVAYPAVDAARAARLARLARQARVRVAVDSGEGIAALADAARSQGTQLGILVDVDIGFHRTGVQSVPEALQLARQVREAGAPLRLDGLFFYPGHVWAAAEEQRAELTRIDAMLQEVIEAWRGEDLPAEIISGGSTPTAYQSHWVTAQTEIRPGTYVYHDMNTVRAGFCELDECAAGVVCTVVSAAVPGKVVIDAGTKTLTSDRNVPDPESGFGHVLEYPAARVTRLSEEHGEIEVGDGPRPKVGERVVVIPNHICPCVNLQDAVWFLRDGELDLETVDARGRLQ